MYLPRDVWAKILIEPADIRAAHLACKTWKEETHGLCEFTGWEDSLYIKSTHTEFEVFANGENIYTDNALPQFDIAGEICMYQFGKVIPVKELLIVNMKYGSILIAALADLGALRQFAGVVIDKIYRVAGAHVNKEGAPHHTGDKWIVGRLQYDRVEVFSTNTPPHLLAGTILVLQVAAE